MPGAALLIFDKNYPHVKLAQLIMKGDTGAAVLIFFIRIIHMWN